MLEAGLVRLLAPNPSPLTGEGTNTYLLGEDALIVIDPGPDLQRHLQALLAEIGARKVAAILVTHSHQDHSGLVQKLKAATGAPCYGFGPSGAGRSRAMAELAARGDLGGGEGADPHFQPDQTLADGALLELAGQKIEALHTPGHFGNHLCFAWNGALFSGDHVMGWATTLVSPPDGDLTDFMASLGRLSHRSDRAFYPGHGAPVFDPARRVKELLDHRNAREAQVLDALQSGPMTPGELAAAIYTEIPKHLLGAAERNVLAHLIDLALHGKVAPEGPLTATTRFAAPGQDFSA
ncbi:MAG: MBL fold metallo-hydrolase [Pseudomonadota bacterium]